MPELDFQVTGVKAAAGGLSPLLQFDLEISNTPKTERIHSILLQAQIQIAAPGRKYSPGEKERLVEVFGTPDRWGQTLRNKLWTQTTTTVRGFCEKAHVSLPVQCTYDLNVLSAKYFDALESGDVPLLFLFSGSVFYASDDGRLQVQMIPWERECTYRMAVQAWKNLIEEAYPNSAWMMLRRDVFDRLAAFKRENGLATWEELMDRLLPEKLEVVAA